MHYIAAPDNAHESLFSQVRNTMLVTVFVFLGIEGRACIPAWRKNVAISVPPRCSVLSASCAFCVWSLSSHMGYFYDLSLPRFVNLRWQGTGDNCGSSGDDFYQYCPGHIGFRRLSLLVITGSRSVIQRSKIRTDAKILAKENANRVPYKAVWLTNIFIQVFNHHAVHRLRLPAGTGVNQLADLNSLFPRQRICFKACVNRGILLRLWNRDKKGLILSTIALIYSLMMIYAGGVKYLYFLPLFTARELFFSISRERKFDESFTRHERLLFAMLMSGAIIGIYAIAAGLIQI